MTIRHSGYIVDNIAEYLGNALRVWTPLIVTWLAICAEPDKEDDCTNNRNEADEIPPTALTNVVKTANAYCQTWNKNSNRVDVAEESKSNKCENEAKNEAKDKIKKGKHPVLRTTCATREISILP